VSRTPVREAIRLLVASGLVQARPHRSAVVARPDKPQLIAMFEARQELEALCASFAAQRMSDTEIKRLDKLNEALAEIVSAGDPQAYFENNETFHDAIHEGAHNDILADLARATRARVAPFSRAQFRTMGRLERSYAEHKGIVEAIARRDAVGAAQAMRDHIAIVREVYAASNAS
jgi:DNA-binding GntR family transcriptional regulator